jgi:hypothetical protein
VREREGYLKPARIGTPNLVDATVVERLQQQRFTAWL